MAFQRERKARKSCLDLLDIAINMRKSARGNSGIPNEDSDYLRPIIGHL